MIQACGGFLILLSLLLSIVALSSSGGADPGLSRQVDDLRTELNSVKAELAQMRTSTGPPPSPSPHTTGPTPPPTPAPSYQLPSDFMMGKFQVSVINGTCDPRTSVPASWIDYDRLDSNGRSVPRHVPGYCVATLDFTSPYIQPTASNNGQATSKALPTGWQLATYSEDVVKILSRMSWGADYLVFSDGKTVCTSATSTPGRVLEHPSNGLDRVQGSGCINGPSYGRVAYQGKCAYSASHHTSNYLYPGGSSWSVDSRCSSDCTPANKCRCDYGNFVKYAPSTTNARVLIQKSGIDVRTPTLYVKAMA